ncbi:MAG: hypothetical protein QOH89_2453 [Pseudonocardiales bacterium]|nr:hypothetical protein [Pseudonocardiales bacterium]
MCLVTERAAQPVSPRPRRIAAPSWLDIRLWLGVGLVLGSVLLGASVLAAARHTSSVVAARRDLAAGTVLAAGDLTLVQVRLQSGSTAYAETVADAVGKQLSRPVSGGELVPVAALGARTVQTTITVPFEGATAPDLRKGDRIEVWLSVGRCAAAVLLPQVTVQAAHTDTGAFGSGPGGQDVIVSLPPELADRVITALSFDDAQLRAGILTGATPAGETVAPLPDVGDCAPALR